MYAQNIMFTNLLRIGIHSRLVNRWFLLKRGFMENLQNDISSNKVKEAGLYNNFL